MSNTAPQVTGKKFGTAGAAAPLLFRINDACKMLSISRSTLYDLVARGEIRLVKIAGRSLIPASEIARLAGVGGESH